MATKFQHMFLLVFLISFNLNIAFADDYCEGMKLGWHFYCDSKVKEDDKSAPKNDGSIENAKADLQQIKAKLEDLKIRAVIYPTEANTLNYIAYQQEQLERASQFSHVWQRVLRNNPNLDYTVSTPISGVGNQLVQEIKKQDLSKILSRLNERYGLFFFYGSKCIHCHKYSPILKVFANTFGLEVVPVSIDGGILPEWPNSMVNNGQLEKLGLSDKPVPATVLFDNKSKQLLPVGFGLLTISELEERIYTIVNEENSYE